MEPREAFQETFRAAHEVEKEGGDCTCQTYHEDDPDCELHHPDMIEDQPSRQNALRWWLQGWIACENYPDLEL